MVIFCLVRHEEFYIIVGTTIPSEANTYIGHLLMQIKDKAPNCPMRPWQTPLAGFQTNDHVYADLVLKAVLRPFQGICEIATIFPTQRQNLLLLLPPSHKCIVKFSQCYMTCDNETDCWS